MTEHVYETDLNFDLRSSWYEDDLQLAAELGKNLLERNQLLEIQLQQATTQHDDHKLEIDLLQRQLEILKNVNESRMKMYEDVDRNAQELEKLNAQLMKDRNTDKDYIVSLKDALKKLEDKNDELNQMMEENAMKAYKSDVPGFSKKRVNSVPSLYESDRKTELSSSSSSSSPWKRDHESEELHRLVNRQQQTMKRLEMQVAIEKNKRKLMENELNNVYATQEALERKYTREIEDLKSLKIHTCVCDDGDGDSKSNAKKMTRPSKLTTSTMTTNPVASTTTLTTATASISKTTTNEMKVEHDLDKLPRGKVVRLKNGGSAYGSRESLHMIGLEVVDDDTTPSVEVCSTILASDVSHRAREQKTREEREAASFSLLAELEEQYQKLVQRYETLIESKQKSNQTDRSTQDNLDHHQQHNNNNSNKIMTSSIDLKSPVDPTEGHFDHGPPEYKRLFKEIFQTLRKSIAYEEDMG